MSSTISITTEAAALNFAATASIGIISVIILLAFLVQKEYLSTATSPAAKRMSQVINIAIVPLFVIFTLIVSSKLLEVMQ
jgi:hypothetical protein